MDTPRTNRVLLQGWEQFDEPVDRIVSIGAFEHFGHDRYPTSSGWPTSALPDDGVMLLHTHRRREPGARKGTRHPVDVRVGPLHQVHHDGDLSRRTAALGADGRGARGRGRLHADPRASTATPLREDARPVGRGLRAHKDEAIAIQSQEVYDRYMKYLTGCAKLFRDRQVDVVQFTLQK